MLTATVMPLRAYLRLTTASRVLKNAKKSGTRRFSLCGEAAFHDLLSQGDAHTLAADFKAAEACFVAAVNESSVGTARAVAWQRLSATLLAQAFETWDPGLVFRAQTAAETALLEEPHNARAQLCKASALSRLGHFDVAAEELRHLLASVLAGATECNTETEIQVRAALMRCCALGAGTHDEVLSQAQQLRGLLPVLTPQKYFEAEGFAGAWLGPLEMEIQLLECIAGVEKFEQASTRYQDVQDLWQELGQHVATACDKPPFEASSVLFPETEPQILTIDIEDNECAFLSKLTCLVAHADRADLQEILWQAFAWRCRLQLLLGNWQHAASDATKALLLNIYAVAELRRPSAAAEAAKTGQQPGVVSVPECFNSRWHCLRMRAAALHKYGRCSDALGDILLLQKLAMPPWAEDSSTSLQKLATWENPRTKEGGGWRRSPEQRAALKRRQRYRRDGAFALPQSLRDST